MEAHYWLFPWLSFFVSIGSAIGALFLCRRELSKSNPPPIPPFSIIVWLCVIALMIFAGLRLGDWASIDYIPARGILVGSMCGLTLSLFIRRPVLSSAAQTAATFAFATAFLCALRLWLTHGELSGLFAAVFAICMTLLCLTAAPALLDGAPDLIGKCTVLSVYLVSLAGAVLIGFTRAGALLDSYWADIPLLFGAALSVGLLIASALDRLGLIARALAVIAAVAVVITPLAVSVAHSLPVVGITTAGAVSLSIPLALFRRSTRRELPIYFGWLLLISGITVAFTLLSGYGLGLFALGMVTVVAVAAGSNIDVPLGWASFTALLLIYRLEILQNVSSTRSIGPGNLWDLLAISLGVILPRACAAWTVDYAQGRLPSRLLQWLAAIIAPSLVLDYIWQPRNLTGLFLGLAIGQLTLAPGTEVDKAATTSFSSILIALLLFLFLPGLDELTAPTRTVRIVCVVVLAAAIIMRIVLHRGQAVISTEAA